MLLQDARSLRVGDDCLEALDAHLVVVKIWKCLENVLECLGMS